MGQSMSCMGIPGTRGLRRKVGLPWHHSCTKYLRALLQAGLQHAAAAYSSAAVRSLQLDSSKKSSSA